MKLSKQSSYVGSLGRVCVCVCAHSGRVVAKTECVHTRTVARGIRLSFGFPPFWYQSMVTFSLVIAVDDRRG
jgi:hypothetical protein